MIISQPGPKSAHPTPGPPPDPGAQAVESPADASAQPKCPDCAGAGRVGAIACSHKGCLVAPVACRTCAGTGTVSPEKSNRLSDGWLLRQDRIGQRLSLNEEAARLDLDSRELNRRERGEA